MIKRDTPVRLSLVFLLLFGFSLLLQGQQNPFDLVPRLAPEDIDTLITASANPFDIVPPPPGFNQRVILPIPEVVSATQEDKDRRFQITAFIGVLLTLVILMTLFRSFISRLQKAFINSNSFNQLHRDQLSFNRGLFLFFYLFFFLAAGELIHLVLKTFDIDVPLGGNLSTWLLLSLGVGLFYAFKHILWSFLGYALPVRKELDLYSFLVMVFNILLGVLLIPANMAIAYSPVEIRKVVVVIVLVSVIGFWGFRCLRALLFTNKQLALHTFHFLLYLCVVEIAPVLVLAKIVQDPTAFS